MSGLKIKLDQNIEYDLNKTFDQQDENVKNVFNGFISSEIEMTSTTGIRVLKKKFVTSDGQHVITFDVEKRTFKKEKNNTGLSNDKIKPTFKFKEKVKIDDKDKGKENGNSKDKKK